MLRPFVARVLALLALSLAGASGAQAPVVLKVHHFLPTGSTTRLSAPIRSVPRVRSSERVCLYARRNGWSIDCRKTDLQKVYHACSWALAMAKSGSGGISQRE